MVRRVSENSKKEPYSFRNNFLLSGPCPVSFCGNVKILVKTLRFREIIYFSENPVKPTPESQTLDTKFIQALVSHSKINTFVLFWNPSCDSIPPKISTYGNLTLLRAKSNTFSEYKGMKGR